MFVMIKLGIIAFVTLVAIMNSQGKVRTISRMKNSVNVTVALDFCLLLLIIFLFK